MHTFAILLAAFLIGIIAGLRTFTGPAAVSWAASLGALRLAGTPFSLLGARITPWILTAMVVAESFIDQRADTPDRTSPPSFAIRILSGAVCGGAIAASSGSWLFGGACGIVGAIVGTLGGLRVRRQLARLFKKDRPAGILEDLVAIGGAVIILAALA